MDSAPPTAATDQPADSAAPTRQCARPGCSNPAPKGPTGRPKQYCSRSCRSKNDRAKAKAREAAAANATPPAAPDAAPGPAAAPLHAAPAAPDQGIVPDCAAPVAPAAAVPADDVLARWGEDGRNLLGVADALRRRLARFLEETAAGDPADAFAELARVLPAYGTRAYRAAQDIRDKARWPDLSEHERLVARSRERIDRWGLDDQDDDGPEETNAPRGETPAPTPAAAPASFPTARPTAGTDPRHLPTWQSAAETAEQARRTACTDPEERFDFPDFLDDLEVTFGPGWELGSWHTPNAQGVLQLRHRSTPIGWTAPLPEGPWGRAGWIALLYQPPGAARLLTDNFSRPKTHPAADLALDAIRRAHTARRPTAPR
ncbi:hypothetical protein ABTZ03_42355 [Kitasatospora sp. NPDC096077]|uniref:hypothetical protein n=1 Tax=Kitasatospora sp. NPDC096077 TaxID=3155544 RepID=UPI0033284D46